MRAREDGQSLVHEYTTPPVTGGIYFGVPGAHIDNSRR